MKLNNEEKSAHEVTVFGWWPELVGVFMVAAMLWFLIGLADGIM